MDISKAFVCALLVLFGLLGAHGFRALRSAGSASASAGANSYASAMAQHQNIEKSIQQQFKQIQDQIDAQFREHQQGWQNGVPSNGVHSAQGQILQPPYPSAQNHAPAGHRFGGGLPGFSNEDVSGFDVSGEDSLNSGSSHHGPASAVSSVNIGPGGGHQYGEISPVDPAIFSRFGEDVPAPSGDNVAVFSSSSSSQSVGPDGKVVSHKSATTGVNDNGKVTIKTVHDP